MAEQYSITITNHSAHPDYFMVFQNDPGSLAPNAMALAWFSKYSNPGPLATVKFDWSIDWGFSWADTGELSPGVHYAASEVLPADGFNKITLDYNRAYLFTDPENAGDPSRFYIEESPTIPVNSNASVGITMAGQTVYAVQARPNSNLTFSPHPVYYLAYGNYSEGLVLDLSSINNPLELKYDTGINALAVTLNPDDSWGPVTTLAERNTRFLMARRENPAIQWAAV